MRISKLELFGFKSFPDRTLMQFGRGISCVVGPNGSGKSNVVDALKWVIGEQSARSLRGAEMSDVIFAGSTVRKPVGFAEVSLTLDVDGGGPFPGEYANLTELQVGRRLHRSGASEYLINQVKCRRKDVVDLFLDTGIGTNLYSFIEQGRVDKVVSATPNERRGLIDEAAGISRYKARREEARSRLEATVQQLDRAADVADEMGRRLKVLERQVVRASMFRRARARVRQREIYLSLVKYRGFADDRRALQKGLREARSEEAAARRGLLRREEDLRVRREEIASVDEAARTWRDDLAEVDARLRELGSQQQLQGQRAREAHEQAEAASTELEQVQGELSTVEEQLAAVGEAVEASERALAGEGASAEERAARRRASSARVEEAQVRKAAAEAEWQRLQAESVRLETERGAAEERRAAVPGVVVKLEAREGELAAEALELTAAQDAAEEALEEARAAEVVAKGELDGRESQLQAVDAERASRLAAYEHARREAMRWVSEARASLDAHRADAARQRADRARAREAAAAAARRARDEAVAVARRRADRWVDGVAGEARRREDAARQALEDAQERWRGLEAEAEGDAQREAEAEATRRLEAAEQQVLQALSPMEQDVRRQRDRLARARHDEEQARVELASLEARLAGLRARLRATERQDALADAVPLVDRLDPSAAATALHGWGRRAALPALDSAEAIVRAIAELPEDAAVELWWWRGGEAPAVGDAADIADALGQHGRAGGAVRFPGGRVEADGTVAYGLHDAAAERVELRRHLQEVEELLAPASERAAQAQHETAVASDALELAQESLADARREGDRALAAARGSALDTTRAHVRQHLEALHEDRDAALEALADVLNRRRASGAAAAESVRSLRERALDEVVASLDTELRKVLAALPAVEAGDDADEAPLQASVDVAEERLEASSVAPELPDREPATKALAQSRSIHQAAVQRRLQGEAAVEQIGQRRTTHARVLGELAERLAEAREEAARWAQRLTDVLASLERVRAQSEVATAARNQAALAHQEELERHQALVMETEGADAARRALMERLDGQRARKGELSQRVGGLTERQRRVVERRDVATARAQEAASAAAAATKEQDSLGGRRSEVFDRLQRERSRREELQEGIRTAEEDLKVLRVRLEKATRGTEQLVDRSAAVRGEIEALRERMDDRYQVGVPGLLDRIERAGKVVLEADEEVAAGLTVGSIEVPGVEAFVLARALLDDEEAVRTAVDEVEEERRRLASLGEVHLGALEEYTELAERHGDLETQRSDLEGSVSQLRAAIAKMNRTCRERFRDAFDRVNENFQLSYPKLLGGGSARLALTDNEDLLETGVEIFVQPPGKRLQHLQLLSGGEKAMTAIALLIALFRVKPSPFCVLDEVDAPLDERNGGRFNTMLRELAQTSQFVVITHNRKTMECADTLYGISMTRPGVSTLVTVSLADAPV